MPNTYVIPPVDGITGRFIQGIKWIVYIVVMLMWAVIGFALWVPLIFRMTLRFTATVMLEAISTDKNYTAIMEARMNYAIAFYPQTFNRISDSVFGDPDTVSKPPDMKGDLKLILIEIAWSAVVWSVVIFSFNRYVL